MRFKIAKLFLALAAVCAACLGRTVYSQSITSSTSSLTITHAQHGFSSTGLAVTVVDGNGNQLAMSAFSYSINSSTYDSHIYGRRTRKFGKGTSQVEDVSGLRADL